MSAASHTVMPMTTADEIMAQFEQVAANEQFPFLDNGYIYPLDTRLSLFRDETRWAMVVELVGYSPRAFDVTDTLHVFGNCLTTGEPGAGNDNILFRIDNYDDVLAPEDEDSEPDTYTGADLIVRGQKVGVDVPAGTPLYKVMRAAAPNHRELFLADDTELHRQIPADLPLILRLDEWEPPDGDFDEFAPEVLASETFQMLAEVLATGDVSRYQPRRAPNTHWSHWPDAGTL